MLSGLVGVNHTALVAAYICHVKDTAAIQVLEAIVITEMLGDVADLQA